MLGERIIYQLAKALGILTKTNSGPVRSSIVGSLRDQNSHRAATVPGYDVALVGPVTRRNGLDS
jgi:hypothetical protein